MPRCRRWCEYGALCDHVSGCRPVLRRIRVRDRDAGHTAALNHVPIVQPRAGIVWNTNDGIILKFVGPSLPLIDGKNASSNNSVAFVLQYKQFQMLLTDDDGAATISTNGLRNQ